MLVPGKRSVGTLAYQATRRHASATRVALSDRVVLWCRFYGIVNRARDAYR